MLYQIVSHTFLPALIPVAISVAKSLALGSTDYADTKLVQKAFKDSIKRVKKSHGQRKLRGKRD